MTRRKDQAHRPRGYLILLVAGALLVLAGVTLAALTEQGLIAYRVAAERHGGAVIDLGDSGQPLASLQGFMVRVTGMVRVDESPLDVQFNQQASTPVLLRHVEMFQWHELEMGGPPVYEQDWEDHPVDSRHFSPGHANPGRFRVEPREFDAGRVRVGAFVLSRTIQRALPGSEPVAPDMHRLPPNLAASFSLHDGALVTSAQPGHPRIGDLRVSWEAVPLQTVTVVAKLDGNRLVPATDAPDGKGFDVDVGSPSLLSMFPDLPVPPEFVWPRRLMAILLAALGVGLLLVSEQRSWGRVIGLSLAASIAAICAVSGVLWLRSSIEPTAIWFGLATIGAGVAVVMSRRPPHG